MDVHIIFLLISQHMQWVDGLSSYLFNLTAQLSISEYRKYANSKLITYSTNFKQEIEFPFVKQLRQKIDYLLKDLNSTSSKQCMALIFTYFNEPVWIPINCTVPFTQISFICERVVGTNSRQSNKLMRRYISCFKYFSYVKGGCYKFGSMTSLQKVRQMTFRHNLIYILSAWALGLNRSIVAIKHFSSSEDVCLCSYTNGMFYQIVKKWSNQLCKCSQAQSALIQRRPIYYVNFCNTNNHVMCNDGTCILYKYQCDGKNDCFDNSDEINCANKKVHTSLLQRMLKNCGDFMYVCGNKECIPLFMFCDGGLDCTDGTDEIACSYIYNYHISPDIKDEDTSILRKIKGDCPAGWSSCSTQRDGFCYPTHMKCIHNRVLDSIAACPGMEHLRYCYYFQCSSMFKVIFENKI